ncbi:hypothetical protein [Streptomyces sp. NBC_01451]|uniref:hypothetical protein n=1 Tax=Streptomyces sp. NBC_01451 TaxID=2903872 RepID=UPI002E31BE1F|nr:hypothetical protein [Streptomyces sp. NBC_01451]
MNVYLKRLAEQAFATALGGFLAAWAASGWDLSQAAFGAAIGAGLRAVYGMAAAPFGDKDSPSVVK